jgi:DNA-binding transcriptional LysR family regulator
LGVEEISGTQKSKALTLSYYRTFLMRWLMPRFHRFADCHGKFDVRFISHDDSPDYSDHCYDMAISTGFPERAETLSVTRLVAECCGSVCRPDFLPEGKRLAARSFVDVSLLHTETRADAWPNWLKMVGNEDVYPSRGQQYEHF